MKAACFMKCGGPEVMEYRDVPDPGLSAGDVMVDVHAASVNGADWKVRSGRYASITAFPYVPGRDFSGVVSAVADGVQGFRPGEVNALPSRRQALYNWRRGSKVFLKRI